MSENNDFDYIFFDDIDPQVLRDACDDYLAKEISTTVRSMTCCYAKRISELTGSDKAGRAQAAVILLEGAAVLMSTLVADEDLPRVVSGFSEVIAECIITGGQENVDLDQKDAEPS